MKWLVAKGVFELREVSNEEMDEMRKKKFSGVPVFYAVGAAVRVWPYPEVGWTLIHAQDDVAMDGPT